MMAMDRICSRDFPAKRCKWLRQQTLLPGRSLTNPFWSARDSRNTHLRVISANSTRNSWRSRTLPIPFPSRSLESRCITPPLWCGSCFPTSALTQLLCSSSWINDTYMTSSKKLRLTFRQGLHWLNCSSGGMLLSWRIGTGPCSTRESFTMRMPPTSRCTTL